MKMLNDVINVILSFKPYVMLPILMFILSMIIGIKVFKALRSCIVLGIGFIGIFIVFDYFVSKIGPVVEIIIMRTGLQLNVLDVGWPPMAAITWSFKLAPILIVGIISVNIFMLWLKLTDTVNIDIWNFWHFIFLGQLVYAISNNLMLSITATLVSSAIVIKLADWSAKDVEDMSGISGVSITTLSGSVYYPSTKLVNNVLDKIPVINSLQADPETIQRKLGFFGESTFIGFIMGIILGVVARYDFKNTLELAFNIGAVVFILPKMSGILGEGLMPLSEGMKSYMKRKFPTARQTHIGLDLAVIVGNPAVIVSGIILMPVALILALTLPGIKFIPIGDLPNMIGAVTMIVVACKGNVIRSVIASVPIIIGKLYVASSMAPVYTNLAARTSLEIGGYSGPITSFLDGGNIVRYWMVKIFTGNILAILFIPIGVYLMFITWKSHKKNKELVVSTEKNEIR
jgi:galactitol PTS system EIIC component